MTLYEVELWFAVAIFAVILFHSTPTLTNSTLPAVWFVLSVWNIELRISPILN